MNKTVSEDEAIAPEQGWHFPRTDPSLPEVHRSVKMLKWGGKLLGNSPHVARLLRLGFLVAVGYMDPGTGPQDLDRECPVPLHALISGDHLQTHSYLSDRLTHQTR